MRVKYIIAGLLLACRMAIGQEALSEQQWPLLKAIPANAKLEHVDGRDVLKIENTNDAPLQVNLLTIEKPKIKSTVYALSGEIRYDSVKGAGYLEMWNYFPPIKPGLPEGGYFSRTLDDAGAMGKITGTSGWRDFSLPFDRTGASGAPTHLQFNLVLPGRGTVYIGPVKLVQMPKVKSAMYPNAWWSGPNSGIIFGWGGGLLGCVGAVCGALASKGRARRVVIPILYGMSVLGGLMVLIGFVAIALGQPFFIWLPMFCLGGFLLAMCPAFVWQFRRRYEELELRRMASMDAA